MVADSAFFTFTSLLKNNFFSNYLQSSKIFFIFAIPNYVNISKQRTKSSL